MPFSSAEEEERFFQSAKMAYYGGYDPEAFHRVPVAYERPAEMVLPDEVRERLQAKARRDVRKPDLYTLVDEVPDVVAWLRGQMTASPTPGEDEGGGGEVKKESKPPFRIAYMDAADREFSALAHWAGMYGVRPGRAWWGRGICADGSTDVRGVADGFKRILGRVSLPDDIMTHPQYGMWTVRCTSYSAWPQLAAIFQQVTVTPEIKHEGLF